MKEDILVNSYIIGNQVYLVLNEIDYNNFHYIFLSNENDEKDMMIRKVVDGVLTVLDNEDEVRSVLKLLCK